MRPESPRQKAAARTEEKAPTTGGEPQRAEPARSVTAIHVCHSSTLAPSLARYARQARGVPAPSQGIRADLQTFIPMQRFVARRARVDRACRFQLAASVGFVLQPHLERGGPTAGRAAQTEDHSPGSAAGSVPQPRTEIE
ncbi:unnamed protein product [Prorocentrum cordatum]|uniref:Uncharacterized protein n=1 Tax=Prorocentrum cordatum TaxID=2364126 RepID=A0ABN9WZK0_9DINO|nr:unnamed protein product [Polarella glacialis]